MRAFVALALMLAAAAVALSAHSADAAARASASHILVSTEKEAQELLMRAEAGEDFAELAKSHSSCPSSRKGGSLGSFAPGQMVSEFNDVVFGKEYEIGKVHGPIKTQFGYHLILITDRTD